MASGAASGQLEVAGRRLKIRNLDRVVFPRTGTTKGKLLDYYIRIAGSGRRPARSTAPRPAPADRDGARPGPRRRRGRARMRRGGASQALLKTSGSKGLQVYVPMPEAVTYADTKPAGKAIAELLERERPDAVVSRMAKSLRAGKVLVDWSQNTEHRSMVCAYSVRAKERPTVFDADHLGRARGGARSRRSGPARLRDGRRARASGEARRPV